METPPSPVPGTDYRPAPLASLPETLDMNYYKWSPEKSRVAAERLAIRARFKREYLLKLNDPQRTSLILDPAVARWAYARTHNVTETSMATPKTSLMGLVFTLGPLFFWYYVFKRNRDHKEKLIQEGKYDQPFHALY